MEVRSRLLVTLILLSLLQGLLSETAKHEASCVIKEDSGKPTQKIKGNIEFRQAKSGGDVTIKVMLSGFDSKDDKTTHGFHVHANADLGNMCRSAGGHYNPEGVDHAGPFDSVRHVGDLGNVNETGEGFVHSTFTDSIISLRPEDGNRNIIGKSIVVHETFDDLGRGGESDSKTTGHAGGRLGCCVIMETTREDCCPNMAQLKPMKDFDEEKFTGLWYSARWYIGMFHSFQWEYDSWDYTHTYFTKKEAPFTLFFERNRREKDTMYCQDPVQSNETRIFPGKYTRQESTGIDATSTVLYTDYNNFAVGFYCANAVPASGCGDVEVVFWSRTKKLRHEDALIGNKIMKKICYPHLAGYIESKHQMDCARTMEDRCSGDKGRMK